MAAQREHVRATLNPKAKGQLEALSDKIGQTQTETLSRLIHWIVALPYSEQLRILGVIETHQRVADDPKK